MSKLNNKYKSGATSIYVVIMATLLFSVIVVGFIRIIINELGRTTSDELAQSAYDSALAGVEDAKTAIKKYYDCSSSDEKDCQNIKAWFKESVDASLGKTNVDDPCSTDAVGKILGRYGATESDNVNGGGEILIQEEIVSGVETVQAYTCVLLNDELADYRAELSSTITTRVIPLKTENPNIVTGLMISWYDETDPTKYSFANASGFGELKDGESAPPTISAQILQTAPEFSISELDTATDDSHTDRGTIFFVPSDNNALNEKNHVQKSTVAASNNHITVNPPTYTRCKNQGWQNSNEFACVATMELPFPVGSNGERNADTFFLVLSLPYGTPTTRFSVQLCTDDDSTRGDCYDASGKLSTTNFKGAQIAVDSTGRANDMYSRVEARVEFNDIYFPFPEFAVQATGSDDSAIDKNFYVTKDCWTSDGSTCDNSGTPTL